MQAEESLRLLQTDHLDLWQVHNLTRMEQVEEIFAKGGAMEALLQAREQKIVRFLGVTGHADPDVLIEAIRRFPFDTLLLALNAAYALSRAKKHGIPCFCVDPKGKDRAVHEAEIDSILCTYQVELVVGAGYMRLLTVVCEKMAS